MKKEVAQEIVEKNKRVYNRIAEQFSSTRQHPWGEFNLFLPYVKSGSQILDVGCGNGRLAMFLEPRQVSYTGVDASSQLVAAAQKKHPAHAFHVATADQLPFPDAQFDTVLLIATLHHIPSRQLRFAVIAEACRVLKPGGHLIMTEWNLLHTQWWRLLLTFSWHKLLGRHHLDWGDIEKPWKNAHGELMGTRYLHLFSRQSLARILRQHGLRVITNQYTTKGHPAHWYDGYNLFTVAEKKR